MTFVDIGRFHLLRSEYDTWTPQNTRYSYKILAQ